MSRCRIAITPPTCSGREPRHCAKQRSGAYVPAIEPETPPDDPADYLRWFVDNHEQPAGSGPYGLEDYCQQVRTYWDARHEPNVHLFHYADMWRDLDGEMRVMAQRAGSHHRRGALAAVRAGRDARRDARAGLRDGTRRAPGTVAITGRVLPRRRLTRLGGSADARRCGALSTSACTSWPADASAWVLNGRSALA